MIKERCKNCVCYEFAPRSSIDGVPAQEGACRLEPPVDGYYPVVGSNRWCSHYRPRPSTLASVYARGHAEGHAAGLVDGAEKERERIVMHMSKLAESVRTGKELPQCTHECADCMVDLSADYEQSALCVLDKLKQVIS